MSNSAERDVSIFRHILRYCFEIEDALAFFGGDEDAFMQSAVFRNAVSMPVQQIGELAKRLSDEFIAAYSEIPWRQIRGMRDWFAHQYLNMDAAVIWSVATNDLAPLRDFCWRYLHESPQ